MAPDSPSPKAPRAHAGGKGSAVFVVGLVLVAVSVLLLGALAAEGRVTPLHDAMVANRNGTITHSYPVPTYVPREAMLEVEYAFPEAPGDVYLLHCVDHERLLSGEVPREPLVRREDSRNGAFSKAVDGYLGYGTTLFYYADNATAGADRAISGASRSDGDRSGRAPQEFCTGAFVAFQWAGTSSASNRPDVKVQVREVPLDSAVAGALFALAAVAALLALYGGLGWSRRRRYGAGPAIGEGLGTAETLYRLVERSEAWLARARRYILISGPLGIFLWYPVLIPWAWRTGRASSGSPWMPWALSAAVLLFLAGLTILWGREFLRLDWELKAWRRHLAELRRREAELMAELGA